MDVLIIGSGEGGGTVLWRLTEQWGNNGKKIGVEVVSPDKKSYVSISPAGDI